MSSSDPCGDWRGTVSFGGLDVRLALHLGETSSFDSPDQGVFGVPCRVARTARHLTVTIAGVGVFAGDLAPDGAVLAGVLRQAGQELPVRFERGVVSSARRPQTPQRPYPYREIEASYDNPAAPGVHLAGTLTRPEGRGPFAAALLVTGSGLHDRDETLFGHKPFLVLADHLTKAGIAVLRVDDRGAGGSTGAGPDDTSLDFASDVAAGVAWLKAQAEIDPARIGLIGHSEGGLIAPLVAARDPSIAFVVLWAGPGVSGRDLVVEQVRASCRAAGMAAGEADIQAGIQARLVDAVLSVPDPGAAYEAALAAATASGLSAEATAGLKTMVRPWYRQFLAYDPAPALRALRCPVLALLGGRDVQVTAVQNEPALTHALAANPRAEVIVLPGLNHLFQTAETGGAAEYGRLEETIAPAALRRIAGWVLAQVRTPP